MHQAGYKSGSSNFIISIARSKKVASRAITTNLHKSSRREATTPATQFAYSSVRNSTLKLSSHNDIHASSRSLAFKQQVQHNIFRSSELYYRIHIISISSRVRL